MILPRLVAVARYINATAAKTGARALAASILIDALFVSIWRLLFSRLVGEIAESLHDECEMLEVE